MKLTVKLKKQSYKHWLIRLAPLMVFWSVLCFSIGLAILGWLVYALKTVPEYIREFERKVLKLE